MGYPTIEDYPYLKLEIDGKSVTLTRFIDYSREPLHGATIDYAFSGKELIKRTPHEPKFMWTVTAAASWEERKKFLYVTQLADRKIFQPPYDAYQLILSDVYLSIVEPTITRPKADSFEEVGELGDIEYFAKFAVAISLSSIREKPLGDYVEISFTINELQKLTA